MRSGAPWERKNECMNPERVPQNTVELWHSFGVQIDIDLISQGAQLRRDPGL